MRAVYTIGHSSRSFEEFVALLTPHAIAGVADVRRIPVSRRYPHFSGPALAQALAQRRVDWRHFPGLGGFRTPLPHSPHRVWTNEAFRGYADHMETPAFAQALLALEEWAQATTVAVMCAEADPMECHRRLIADALCRDGFAVCHLLEATRSVPHLLSEGVRIEGGRLIYDAGATMRLPGI